MNARTCAGGEVIETDCRHLGDPEFAAGKPAAMTGSYVAVAIDQDRDIEAEGRRLSPICRICFLLWQRGLAGSSLSSEIGR